MIFSNLYTQSSFEDISISKHQALVKQLLLKKSLKKLQTFRVYEKYFMIKFFLKSTMRIAAITKNHQRQRREEKREA